MMQTTSHVTLRELFGNRYKENVLLSGYTAARIGGPADGLVIVRSAQELEQAAVELWKLDVPFLVIGGGSNVLVSDKGVRGVVIINRARQVTFDTQAEPSLIQAEAGTSLNDLAQRAERHGFSGLEWAATIPGSVGGAVYGNAGAFGGDMAGSLVSIELVHRQTGKETWLVEKMGYAYRSSILKREHLPVIILSATLTVTRSESSLVRAKMDQFNDLRRTSQPKGASLGSMFKNPPGDKAGRLIDSAGLKGTRIGNAEISTQHANFFINNGMTRAEDMKALLDLAQKRVFDQFGVSLEPEIEMIGEW